MCQSVCALAVFCLILLLPVTSNPDPQATVTVDFSGRNLPKDWRVSTKAWKVKHGELAGEGNGYLEYKRLIKDDFVQSFDGRTAEKGNIEVVLLDPRGKEGLFVFAFLGMYHPVLDGVKCAFLKGNRFVSVNPRMWLFPGGVFRFEVRSVKNQFRMFLNRELGPVFKDGDPPDVEGYILRISFTGEGKKDGVKFDNIRLEIG